MAYPIQENTKNRQDIEIETGCYKKSYIYFYKQK